MSSIFNNVMCIPFSDHELSGAHYYSFSSYLGMDVKPKCIAETPCNISTVTAERHRYRSMCQCYFASFARLKHSLSVLRQI